MLPAGTADMAQISLSLVADTRLANRFVRMASVLVGMGWNPGPRAERLLLAIAGRLVRVGTKDDAGRFRPLPRPRRHLWIP